MVRALFTILVAATTTIFPGSILLVAAMFGRGRGIQKWVTQCWAKSVLWAAGVRLDVEGGEGLESDRPLFFVGNHQSALDIPILIAGVPVAVTFMAKDTLFRIPLFGWILRSYGYIPVDRRSARKTLASRKWILDSRRDNMFAMAVFPEVTRSDDGRLLPFRRGALKIGRLTGLPIVPFTIDGSVNVHRRGVLRCVPGRVRLVFHAPLTPEEVASQSADDLHDRIHRAIASELPGQDREPRDSESSQAALTAAAEGL